MNVLASWSHENERKRRRAESPELASALDDWLAHELPYRSPLRELAVDCFIDGWDARGRTSMVARKGP